MQDYHHKTRHQTVKVDGLDIFYRHAGDREKPAILMLHGYPTSSYMFRNVIEPLAETANVVAPDMPSFGYSSVPSPDDYNYTYENLADTMEALLAELGIETFFLYVHDFGTPVGYHLATRRPDRIRGIIVQNGNTHEEGLGSSWDASRVYFADPSKENRAKLPDWMNFETTRYQYVGEQPDRIAELYPPDGWHLDWDWLSRPGHTDIQFRIFTDYGSHIARFPAIEAYHREHQPPCLMLWGRHDPFFDINEIMAYNRVLESLEIHVFESGHQLLETHHRECASLVGRFMRDVEAGRL